ncbi:hypothetical protein GON26_09685 [Flavobacterium sp. GA093]|uniref:SMI1/KNR4 family protein n=1 Tax=Flavobacterium hydrocarbonoxydans TaxID=2683249 RepID=A0A6I4NUD0_9FLAO|nr:SMI1/KNR4 family protein [Flavobacterium hydrocarbonoxydans]MWB94634.1 hypothetical protein [Flavobacterium hydrocarbonoxydans]
MSEFEKLTDKINLIGSPTENEFTENKWELFENTNGIKFPAAYKNFINYYGTGCLCELIWVLNPFSNSKRFNLLSYLEDKKKAFTTFEEITKEKYPYSLFHEGKGILPFAFTDNGDTFYWEITSSKSKEYKILLFDGRELLIEEYSIGFSELLLQILNKSLKTNIINKDDIRGCNFNPLSV